ncbi:MAG: hypothetical protein H6836_06550 [Planctomycetes bacterium]|nr:hypothetical protein [Planctomycetota bacterium]
MAHAHRTTSTPTHSTHLTCAAAEPSPALRRHLLAAALLLAGCSAGGGDAGGGTRGGGTPNNNDITPPSISEVRTTPGLNSAVVTWQTDELATSALAFGTTEAYEIATLVDPLRVTDHSIKIEGLAPNTAYHFTVVSVDPSNNEARTADRVFTTTTEPDTTAPKITKLVVIPGHDSVRLTWETDEPALHGIEYGRTTTYQPIVLGNKWLTRHDTTISGLTPSTTYHFRVHVTDLFLNVSTTADATFDTTAAPDTTPPQIRDIAAGVGTDTATITWNTDEPATSLVRYGTTTGYELGSKGSQGLVTSHQTVLTGLSPDTLYHFRVTSADAKNNSASSGDLTFRTDKLPSGNKRTSISQFGITWTFDKAYDVGQYANGDWWVIGPIKVIDIDPPSRSGGRIKNGSQINPTPRTSWDQGYDSEMDYCPYKDSMNVALDVSASKPLTVAAHSSLVSTISLDAGHQKPQLKGCSILTVVDKAPATGAFRPPYCGSDKTSKFHVNQLNYSLLKKLDPASGTPALSTVESWLERPWLDYFSGWVNIYQHPTDNMKGYQRDHASDAEIAALMLQCNFTDQQKQTLLIRYVQLGIDLSGVVDDGGQGNWYADGGTASGRKWPIIFAGLVLGDQHMQTVGFRSVAFGEDQQTFYVEETSPGIYNQGYGGYNASHKGMPEWGIRHAYRPSADSSSWSASYRRCCTANVWKGFMLSALMMKARGLWNHEPFFDYMDRYIPTSRGNNDPSWMTSWEPWTLAMWDKYRKDY